MNWLEMIFGISPDNGNGAAELLVAFGIALAFASAMVGGRRLVRHVKIKAG